MMNLGATYMRQGRHMVALRTYEQAAAQMPDSALPWQQIALCHFHLKDYEEALSAYQRAIERDPMNAASHRGMGVVYMTRYVVDRSRGDLRDRSLAAWHRSLELDPRQQDLVELVRKYAPPTAPPPL